MTYDEILEYGAQGKRAPALYDGKPVTEFERFTVGDTVHLSVLVDGAWIEVPPQYDFLMAGVPVPIFTQPALDYGEGERLLTAPGYHLTRAQAQAVERAWRDAQKAMTLACRTAGKIVNHPKYVKGSTYREERRIILNDVVRVTAYREIAYLLSEPAVRNECDLARSYVMAALYMLPDEPGYSHTEVSWLMLYIESGGVEGSGQ